MSMNKTILAMAALSMAATINLTSCSGGKASDSDSEESAFADTTLHAVDIDLTAYSIAKSFAITDSAAIDSSFLALSADLQWPRKIGRHDIDNLHTAILKHAFNAGADADVKECVTTFVSDPVGVMELEGHVTVTPIGHVVPPGINSYYINMTGSFTDMGKQLLTYQINNSSFLGGPHPNYTSFIFTFDVNLDRVITLADLVSPEKTALFSIGAKKQLADQMGMSIAELNQSMLTSEFTLSDDIYISKGMIYIHYNPYEILPFSMGTIDIEMSPYEYSSLLTPYARELLLD